MIARSPPAALAVSVARPEREDRSAAGLAGARLRSIVSTHYPFLWRLLRRLGVPSGEVEDACQTCLWVVAKRLNDIAPEKEKTFLFGVAVRVSKAARRDSGCRVDASDEELLDNVATRGPDAGEQLDARRARAVLDALLESMPTDLRTVFVLYEIEELTMAEIACALDIPPGTVASRLRRARVTFEALSRRVRQRLHEKEQHK